MSVSYEQGKEKNIQKRYIFMWTSPDRGHYTTPPFPSSAFCLLVAPCQVIGRKHLPSIVNHLPSEYQAHTNQVPINRQSSTNQLLIKYQSTVNQVPINCQLVLDWRLIGTWLADVWLCLANASCQSLDKEQQANRKRLTEMVVYLICSFISYPIH